MYALFTRFYLHIEVYGILARYVQTAVVACGLVCLLMYPQVINWQLCVYCINVIALLQAVINPLKPSVIIWLHFEYLAP